MGLFVFFSGKLMDGLDRRIDAIQAYNWGPVQSAAYFAKKICASILHSPHWGCKVTGFSPHRPSTLIRDQVMFKECLIS